MAYTTIDNPALFFNTIIWSGDDTARTISGVGFQPDWIWWKQRNGTDSHRLADSVRGEGSATFKLIFSEDTSAEYDGNDNGGSQGNINDITSDGFSGVQGSSGYNNWNGSSYNYVAWNWKAGTSFSNDASATGVGDIDSSGSINTDAGFSIIGYNGNNTSSAGIAHGLGTTPSMIIQKRRADSVASWRVWHNRIHATSGETNTLLLNTSAANASDSDNISGVSSTTFTVRGAGGATNPNGSACIAYCFAEKKGYSKFGSYTGNGSTSGPFVYTGFKPAWVMMKRTNGSNSWNIFDNKRATDNPVQHRLFPDTTDAEATSSGNAVDFLSNGFVGRSSGSTVNHDGGTYIYMAFAETPFVSAGTKAAGTAR